MENNVLLLEKTIETTTILPELTSNDNNFNINAIASIESAIKLLKKDRYSLIYINIEFLDMRIIPLFEVLINKKYLGQIIFAGDYKNPQVVKKIGYFKALDVLIKPFDSIWLKNSIINNLKTGKLIGNDSEKLLSLYFILKIIDFEKGSITLKVNFDGKKGIVVLKNGIAVYAKYNKKDGIAALKLTIGTRIPFNKRSIFISNPGFFIKDNLNTNLSSILEGYDSSGTIITPNKKNDTGPVPSLISFMTGKVNELYSKNAEKIIENTIVEMGFLISTFPLNEEIDLIEKISNKIEDTGKRTEFKNSMANFIITREKNS